MSGEILRASWPWVFSGAVLVMVFNAATMLVPVVIGAFIDEVIAPAVAGVEFASILSVMLRWAAALLGLYVAINLSWRFGGRLGWYGVQRTQHELTMALLARQLDVRGSGTRERTPGESLAVSTGDVQRTSLVMYAAVYPPGETVGLAVGVIVLFQVHPWLGIGVVVALPLVLLLMHLAARPIVRRSTAEQSHLADATATAEDLVRGYRVLRGIHAQDRAAKRFRTLSQRALRTTIEARGALAAFDGLTVGAAQCFAAAVTITAALLAHSGRMSVGEFITASGVAVVLVEPLDSLVSTLGTFWARSQASAARVLGVLAEPANPAALGERKSLPGTGTLTFSSVEAGVGIHIDGTLPAGALVVLDLDQREVTLVTELLVLHRLPVSGEVCLGGQNLRSLHPAAVRSRILVLPHTPGLFAGSVRDNVRCGTETSDIEVDTALSVAGISPEELSGGYDAEVGPSGNCLSGGQRQRIALARAIAADPEILVLVEPTTSVDAITELRIARALRDHRAGRTTLVISGSAAWADAMGQVQRSLRVRSEHA